MSNDRLILAVNELVSKYEFAAAKNIDMDADANLDILQFSNLHKSCQTVFFIKNRHYVI